MKNQVQKDYIQHNYTKTTKTKDISFQIIYPAKLCIKQENKHRIQVIFTLVNKKVEIVGWNGQKPHVGEVPSFLGRWGVSGGMWVLIIMINRWIINPMQCT